MRGQQNSAEKTNTETSSAVGLCFSYGSRSIYFEQCSEIGESLETSSVMKKSVNGELQAYRCVEQGVRTQAIRLVADPSLIHADCINELIELQEEAQKTGRRMNQQRTQDGRHRCSLRSESPEKASLEFGIYNAFPSAIEFINLDEENKQKFVLEISFDEIRLESFDFGASDGGPKTIELKENTPSTSDFAKLDSQKSAFSCISMTPQKMTLDLPGFPVELHTLNINCRYLTDSYSFGSQPMFERGEGNNAMVHGQEDETWMTDVGAYISDIFTKHKPEMVTEWMRGRKNRYEIVSLEFFMFQGFTGKDSDSRRSLTQLVEAIFLPLIYNSEIYKGGAHGFKRLGHHFENIDSGPLEIPESLEELSYPKLLYKLSGNKVQYSIPSETEEIAPVVCRFDLGEKTAFTGVPIHLFTNYDHFDVLGMPQRARIQLRILGVHELNSKQEIG